MRSVGIVLLALVLTACAGSASLVGPCPRLQHVIGHEFNTTTCTVLP